MNDKLEIPDIKITIEPSMKSGEIKDEILKKFKEYEGHESSERKC